MLVLTRRTGQKIVIGNEVVVELLGIAGDTVKLGISAPSETSVHRHEIFLEIQQANFSADLGGGSIDGAALESLSGLFRTRNNHEAI